MNAQETVGRISQKTPGGMKLSMESSNKLSKIFAKELRDLLQFPKVFPDARPNSFPNKNIGEINVWFFLSLNTVQRLRFLLFQKWLLSRLLFRSLCASTWHRMKILANVFNNFYAACSEHACMHAIFWYKLPIEIRTKFWNNFRWISMRYFGEITMLFLMNYDGIPVEYLNTLTYYIVENYRQETGWNFRWFLAEFHGIRWNCREILVEVSKGLSCDSDKKYPKCSRKPH